MQANHDMTDPLLSLVNGDFGDFPPTILTNGTHDLFLSDTVRVHRKLHRFNVKSALHVYE
uniref:Alpha/beta hydrolase fold-3 domain-containing protein n=1 Tax=OCS116 cluster bacterium TaxID=2030921 RepID=A0A2A4YUX7_9PROT